MDVYVYGDTVTMICTTLCCSKVQFLYGSIIVCGGISRDARTDLHFFDSIVGLESLGPRNLEGLTGKEPHPKINE